MALNGSFVAATIKTVTGPDQTNLGEHVVTNQVQETVYAFMAIITIMILIFLTVHLFIRFHYKAKTDYALNELKEKYEKDVKGPSPYAQGTEQDMTKPFEMIMEPATLAPIVHHAALAPVLKVEKPNQHVIYMDAS